MKNILINVYFILLGMFINVIYVLHLLKRIGLLNEFWRRLKCLNKIIIDDFKKKWGSKGDKE